MRLLVLDTNVWLDWLVFDDPGIAPLREDVAAGRCALVLDAACLDELERVLGYPLRGVILPPAERAQRTATARGLARWCTATATQPLPRCRDPDDQKLLELARNAGAAALLTKDKALLELARRRHQPLPFAVITPAAYASAYRVGPP